MGLSDIYSWGIGAIVVAFLICLIPAFIAYYRGHAYRHIILLICIFGSWTMVLWLAALIWSAWPTEKSLIDPLAGNATGKGKRNSGHTIGDIQNGISEQTRNQDHFVANKIDSNINNLEVTEKKCPFCAEKIKSAAKICRFCNSSLEIKPAPTPEIDNELIALYNENYSDEDYIKNNQYKKYFHDEITFFILPNKNYVIQWLDKYLVLNNKQNFDEAIKNLVDNQKISYDLCIKVTTISYVNN